MVGNYINNIVSNQYKNHTFIFLSRSDCDLINREAVIQYFNKKDIDYIIHLAASVGGIMIFILIYSIFILNTFYLLDVF